MLLARLFDRLIKFGTLTVIDANGKSHSFGGEGGPNVTLRLHDKSLHYKMFFRPQLYAGEAYMDGTLTIEEGTLYDFLDMFLTNVQQYQPGPVGIAIGKIAWCWNWFSHLIPPPRARANVAHHYDLSGTLYDLFLDKDRQYSCAYFVRGNETLEAAQDNKKRHIAAKLLLDRPGLKILDIGSGWGGLALYLAEVADAEVTGITLSEEQVKVSNERARDAGLDNRVHFECQDYRDLRGQYDRIVSVGMFEHVGAPQYDEFFRQVHDLLKPDGVALLHSIGCMGEPEVTSPWLRKYIFPGGHTPALSEVQPSVEKSGLWVTDVEILRLHYAETIKHWHTRFEAHRDEIRDLYDERFCRMWELYLLGCELAFRRQGHMVFQMQLARDQEAVPLTRDYITAWEDAHRPDQRVRAVAKSR
ncbi:MAG: cyclopropane-fatty-acyl-phospholipid synthase family protein [Alphaproteobacteria bacterium]